MPRFQSSYGKGEATGAALQTAPGVISSAKDVATGNVVGVVTTAVTSTVQAGAQYATAKEQAKALAAQGKSAVEIAKATGVTEREAADLMLIAERERRKSERQISDLVLPAVVGLVVLVVAGGLLLEAVGTDEEEEAE